jgi:hypothetical protein
MHVRFCVPIQLVYYTKNEWTMGEFLCKSASYLQNVSVVASIATLNLASNLIQERVMRTDFDIIKSNGRPFKYIYIYIYIYANIVKIVYMR